MQVSVQHRCSTFYRTRNFCKVRENCIFLKQKEQKFLHIHSNSKSIWGQDLPQTKVELYLSLQFSMSDNIDALLKMVESQCQSWTTRALCNSYILTECFWECSPACDTSGAERKWSWWVSDSYFKIRGILNTSWKGEMNTNIPKWQRWPSWPL